MSAVLSGDVWVPGEESYEHSNLAQLMRSLGTADYQSFLTLSVDRLEDYWRATLDHLGIAFDPPATSFLDLSEGAPWARFFVGGGFNYAAACLQVPEGAADRLALSWEDEAGGSGSLTYAQLGARTQRFASGLRKLGVAAGDRVAILMPSSAEAVIALLAVGYVGAIAVPLYSGYGVEAVESRVRDAAATCLITADGFQRRGRYISLAALAGDVQKRLPSLSSIVVFGREDACTATYPYRSWDEIERSGDADMPPHRTGTNDPFMVIYTSGTSGRPKGAVHVHGGFPLRVAQDVAFLFDFKPGDRFFWMSDMGWMVGPFSICSVLLNKGTLVLYDGAPDVPDIGRLRAVATRHRVTHFGSSPTAVRAMAADARRALSAAAADLRVLMTGGEVMDADAHRWYFQRFGSGRLPIVNYTGGTEVSGAILTNVVLRPILPCRFNSTAPGVRGVIVNGEGAPVLGAPGELAIAQPFVGMTRGFWCDTGRYLETYWSRIPGLWVHGDLAMAEPEGQYLLLGRSDDVMKIAGKRVGPSEVEGMLIDGATVLDAVVFGVPDAFSGEAMVVLLVTGVPGGDAQSLHSTVTNRLQASMGRAFKPRFVVPVRRLVKTRNGKLIRRLARQAWLGETAGDLTAVEDPLSFNDLAEDCERHRQAHAEKL